MLWRQGKAYPQEMRERVFVQSDAGVPVGQIAMHLLVSISYVSKVLSRRERTGETSARPQVCHVPPKLSDHELAIREQLGVRSDMTLEELKQWLSNTRGVPASTSLLSITLRRLGLTLKKSRARRRARSAGDRRGTRRMAREPELVRSTAPHLHR